MKRSMMAILVGLGLVATPALAQQPLQPAPYPPADAQQYGSQPAQPQYDPYAQQQQQYGQQQYGQPQQPIDPYAAYGDSTVGDDDDDDGYDVTYDVSMSNEDSQYDDGYDPNAYTQFESSLSPYGTWEDVPDYGHVWVPSSTYVGWDFTPYATGGHWVMSDYGWTWVSDWNWGWAPFHYGRWMYAGSYGWCWLPGTHWGPGWVDWRFGGGYAGWAPMGPRGVVVGPPRGVRSPWRFTTAAQLGAVHPRYLPSRAVAGVWGHTMPIHNVSQVSIGGTQVRFNAGPPAHVVAAAVGHPIAPVALRTVAPRALPTTAIQPRAGVPLQQRTYIQSHTVGGTFARTVPGTRTLGTSSTAMAPRPLATRPATGAWTQQPYRSASPYAYRAPSTFGQAYHAPYAQPYRAAPTYGAPYASHYATPQYHYGAPAYHYSAPAYHYAAPAYRAPAYAAPAYRAPAYSAPHFAAPAPAYSAPRYTAPAYPAPHYSAPAAHYTAPAFHGGGSFGGGAVGGFRGGGRR